MSFVKYKKFIEQGDTVIAYLNRDTMVAITVKPSELYHNRFGVFKHDDMIGKQYGTKLASNNQQGFIHLLHPTPELWTLTLPHRTQILYIADIALITALLDMKSGSKVIESGTGSGSFSHSIARTVAPHGHLYSFEYHEERSSVARKEFQEHGIADLVTVQCRDVCKQGFGMSDEVDAVFLDLPAPWEAIPSAKAAFKQNQSGQICCFSPCIEQVQRTCVTLRENGFKDIKMYECLMKSYDTRKVTIPSVKDVISTQAEEQRKRVRLFHEREIERESGRKNDTPAVADDNCPSVNLEDDNSTPDIIMGDESTEKEMNDAIFETSNSKSKDPEETLEVTESTSDATTKTTIPGAPSIAKQTRTSTSTINSRFHIVAKPPAEVRGHTSYLTFATFVPDIEVFMAGREVL